MSKKLNSTDVLGFFKELCLFKGDSNPHSKKAKKDRYAELYSGISESLYSYLSANLEQLIFANNKPKFVVGCLETTCE